VQLRDRALDRLRGEPDDQLVVRQVAAGRGRGLSGAGPDDDRGGDAGGHADRGERGAGASPVAGQVAQGDAGGDRAGAGGRGEGGEREGGEQQAPGGGADDPADTDQRPVRVVEREQGQPGGQQHHAEQGEPVRGPGLRRPGGEGGHDGYAGGGAGRPPGGHDR